MAQRVCIDFHTMTDAKYVAVLSELLNKYITSERRKETKWWGFMSTLNILQLSYFLCNIPYYPRDSEKLFSAQTKDAHLPNAPVRTRQNTIRHLVPLFNNARLIAPTDENTYPYCTYLIVKNVMFVSVRGTTLSPDWIINANAFMNSDALFHLGFYNNAVAGVKALYKIVNEHKLTFNKIVFTGHSMGAATASIMSYIYKNENNNIDVESLVLSCPKFCDPVKGKRLWTVSMPHSLHMYTSGDITPTIIIGVLSRPFAPGNELELCLPVAISKDETYGYRQAFGIGDHLLYASTALHTNYYKDMHIIGSYGKYSYIKTLCTSPAALPNLSNVVGKPFPIFEKTGKQLHENECKERTKQARSLYKYFKAGAGLKLLGHALVAVLSTVANIVGFLSVHPDLIGFEGGGGVNMFSQNQFLGILNEVTRKVLEQLKQSDNGRTDISSIGSIQTNIIESMAYVQTGKPITSDSTGIMVTHYLIMLHSVIDDVSIPNAQRSSLSRSRSMSHSSVSRASAAPASASPVPVPVPIHAPVSATSAEKPNKKRQRISKNGGTKQKLHK